MSNTHFISVDWGTTNLRIRLVAMQSLRIINEITPDMGVKAVYNLWVKEGGNRGAYFLAFLKEQIDRILKEAETIPPVLISGMASSSIGLKELPYAKLPFHVDGSSLHVESIKHESFINGIYLISGVKSNTDVIRGEEVQMVGLLDEKDKGTAVVVLPGTHSKHVIVKNGEVVDFKTYMTGELFDIISKHSILNTSIKATNFGSDALTSFQKGVLEASKGNSILNKAFGVRTNSLFNKMTAAENYFYLSGLIIGEELAELKKQDYNSIKLCAGGTLSELYKCALEQLDLESITQLYPKETVDVTVVKGQWKVFRALKN